METLTFQLTEKAQKLLQENCRHIQTKETTGYDIHSLRLKEKKCSFCGKIIQWDYI